MHIMAIAIIPVAVSVHTIVSWDFAMTPVPMWHSTIFGPYFVVGAIFSGIAALILAMALLRKFLHLEEYLKPMHFENLGKLLLTMSLLWFYFTFAERLTTWYGNDALGDGCLLVHHPRHTFAPLFWTMVVCNFIIPVPDSGHQEIAHDHRNRASPPAPSCRHVARALPDHRACAGAQVPALLLGNTIAPPGWRSR